MGLRAPYDNGYQYLEWQKLLERTQMLLDNPDSSSDLQSETSAKFFGLAVGAMLVSRHKYGLLAQGYPENVKAIGNVDAIDPATFDKLGSFGKRLRWYFFGEKNLDFGEPGEPEYDIEPGNAEYLVDAANMLMIEFMHPAHPKAHYTATDSAGSPGRVAQNTELYGERGNQFKNTDLVSADEKASL